MNVLVGPLSWGDPALAWATSGPRLGQSLLLSCLALYQGPLQKQLPQRQPSFCLSMLAASLLNPYWPQAVCNLPQEIHGDVT